MDVRIFRAESETNLNGALQAAEKFMLQMMAMKISYFIAEIVKLLSWEI